MNLPIRTKRRRQRFERLADDGLSGFLRGYSSRLEYRAEVLS
ncbi:hypothetical protein [Sutterella wadsworthensis]